MELVARRPIVRAANLAKLRAIGFAPVDWFPLREHRAVVRPTEEIAHRTLALAALWAWAALSEADLRSSVLVAHIERNGLRAAMTSLERELLEHARGSLSNEVALLLDATAPIPL